MQITLFSLFSFLKVFEDVYLPSKPKLQKTLNDLNYFFAFIFALEFVLKIIGLGIVRYFASFWNCLDSLIVAVSNFHLVTWLMNTWNGNSNFLVFSGCYPTLFTVSLGLAIQDGGDSDQRSRRHLGWPYLETVGMRLVITPRALRTQVIIGLCSHEGHLMSRHMIGC